MSEMQLIMENWREFQASTKNEVNLNNPELLEEGLGEILSSIGSVITGAFKIPQDLKELYNLVKSTDAIVAKNLPARLGTHWDELKNDPPPELKAALAPMIAALELGAALVAEKGAQPLQEEEKASKASLIQRIKTKNTVLAARWSMWDIMEAKLNQAESYEDAQEKWEKIVASTAQESPEWKEASKQLVNLTNDIMYKSIMAEVEQAMGKLPPKSLGRFMRAIVINSTAEFIFGFFDNFVLVMIGAGIDDYLMTQFGLGKWVASTWGNTGSDAGGGFFAKLNTYIKRYTTNPKKTAFSREISQNYPPRMANLYDWSGLIGLIAGCIVGSIPAYFIKTAPMQEQQKLEEIEST